MGLLVRNIKGLAGIADNAILSKAGREMGDITVIPNAWLLAEEGMIVDYGFMEECPDRSERIIDATGCFVLPTWCDSHTHIVYAGSREQEFVDRIHGLNYEEIARRGGGILNSARLLNDTSADDLYEAAWLRLEEITHSGTGAVEIKSGYGLTIEGELKMLRVIQRLKDASPLTIKSTFLGAHAVPLDYRENREAYVKLLINDLLPAIAGEGLADYIDVFCDRGFFTPDETSLILEAGAKFGLKPKIHANELDYSGGIQTGVAHQAVSVDHLEFTGEDEISCLQDSQTIPTLLPSTAFFLRLQFPPARKMIDNNLPVALASDYNPGSSPSGNMPFVLSLACIQMEMDPNEAINAATINGAAAMELSESHGTIRKGTPANFFITKPIPSLAFIPYSFGNNVIDKVFLKGMEV